MIETWQKFYKTNTNTCPVLRAEALRDAYALSHKTAREVAISCEVEKFKFKVDAQLKERLMNLYEWPKKDRKNYSIYIQELALKLVKRKVKLSQITNMLGVEEKVIVHWCVGVCSLKDLGKPHRRSCQSNKDIIEIYLSNSYPTFRAIAEVVNRTPERVRQVVKSWKNKKLFKHEY